MRSGPKCAHEQMADLFVEEDGGLEHARGLAAVAVVKQRLEADAERTHRGDAIDVRSDCIRVGRTADSPHERTRGKATAEHPKRSDKGLSSLQSNESMRPHWRAWGLLERPSRLTTSLWPMPSSPLMRSLGR